MLSVLYLKAHHQTHGNVMFLLYFLPEVLWFCILHLYICSILIFLKDISSMSGIIYLQIVPAVFVDENPLSIELTWHLCQGLEIYLLFR